MTSTVRGVDNFNTDPTVRSMVQVRGCNGYGSVNTACRRWTTLVGAVGSDITFTQSATLADAFTINADGIYAVTYSDQFNIASTLAITNTSNNLAASPNAADILACMATGGSNFAGSITWAGYLPTGTVIRARNFTAPGIPSGTTPAAEQFTIVRVK